MRPVHIRQADLITLSLPLAFLSLALLVGGQGHEWAASVATWVGIVVLGCVALLLPSFVQHRATDILMRFWPVAVPVLLHSSLNPLIDRLNPVLYDDPLLRFDAVVLGTHPSVWAEHAVPPALFDLLMVAYATFFLWPVILGVVLYTQRRLAEFDSTLTLVILTFFLNYLCYIAVPVVGPRFTLMHEYAGPLQGWLVGAQIFNFFLDVPVNRDCFPSGHTAVTLLVLWQSYRLCSKFFWMFLPVALLILVATVLARFHYTLDLVAAVPFVVAVIGLARVFDRYFPQHFSWQRFCGAPSLNRGA